MPVNIKDLAVAVRGLGPGERIPDRHAADHGNTAPEVEITGVPAGTAELALIVHDPDAPLSHGFTHWVVYGIDPAAPAVPSAGAANPAGTVREGPNSLGDRAYTGPQPPPGHGTHHYYFWVYALDTPVAGEPSREEFLSTYGDRVIEQNRLVGTYSA
ncbi:YbhB/YbcL family Raf kinase inhibitor-like protein [Streptomyces synnematoformans]|uniref:YbhB/YbcL family Raf kinase inhibitor-like protein n=1 Tax=Streptomyces synnematoformans TaxID=415721 RepID=UPI0031D652E1